MSSRTRRDAIAQAAEGTAQQVREVAVATLGAQAVRWNQARSMASEDFACMLEPVRGPISG